MSSATAPCQTATHVTLKETFENLSKGCKCNREVRAKSKMVNVCLKQNYVAAKAQHEELKLKYSRSEGNWVFVCLDVTSRKGKVWDSDVLQRPSQMAAGRMNMITALLTFCSLGPGLQGRAGKKGGKIWAGWQTPPSSKLAPLFCPLPNPLTLCSMPLLTSSEGW